MVHAVVVVTAILNLCSTHFTVKYPWGRFYYRKVKISHISINFCREGTMRLRVEPSTIAIFKRNILFKNLNRIMMKECKNWQWQMDDPTFEKTSNLGLCTFWSIIANVYWCKMLYTTEKNNKTHGQLSKKFKAKGVKAQLNKYWIPSTKKEVQTVKLYAFKSLFWKIIKNIRCFLTKWILKNWLLMFPKFSNVIEKVFEEEKIIPKTLL